MKKILLLLMLTVAGYSELLYADLSQDEAEAGIGAELFVDQRQLNAERASEQAAEQERLQEMMKIGRIEQISTQPNGIDPLSEASYQLVQQLTQGLQQNRVKRLPVAIMPFVNLHSNKKVGRYGERLAEGLIYQMQHQGYNLIDYRAVSLTTSAKAPLSKQNLSGLRTRYKIYFLLTGTYAQHSDGLVVNARVLDTTTRQVLATGQVHISNDRLEGVLPGYNPLDSLNKGLIIENQNGPVAR